MPERILVLLCALGAAVLVRRHDMFDREPWWALAGTALLGALLMSAAGRVEDLVIYAGTDTPSSLWIALNAAFFEGLARVAAVGAVMILLPRIFNDPMDGVTYGSVAGLGMAVYESALYLRAGAPGAAEPARLYGHLVLGGIAAFPLGMVRARMPGAGGAFLRCGVAAFGLHAVIDAAGLRATVRPEFEPAARAIVIACVVVATLLYGVLAVRASEWSRQRFAPGSMERLFRWPF